jgi:hypothetical protein
MMAMQMMSGFGNGQGKNSHGGNKNFWNNPWALQAMDGMDSLGAMMMMNRNHNNKFGLGGMSSSNNNNPFAGMNPYMLNEILDNPYMAAMMGGMKGKRAAPHNFVEDIHTYNMMNMMKKNMGRRPGANSMIPGMSGPNSMIPGMHGPNSMIPGMQHGPNSMIPGMGGANPFTSNNFYGFLFLPF